MIENDPTHGGAAARQLGWWRDMVRQTRSRARHQPATDARQIQFHYDVSDDFYALWLDPLRVYSCAYFRDAGMTLARAQEAKLDHICRKLMLREGERFLDIGAGWGGLLLWAAEHYGVRAHGITLSKNQHAYVNRVIAERGLARPRLDGPARLPRAARGAEPWDKIASIGMFEHVGRAQLPTYFAKLYRLLRPGGAADEPRHHRRRHAQRPARRRPRRLHRALHLPGRRAGARLAGAEGVSEAGLEPVDVENLRPHYGRTLWAWRDALEARLGQARELTRETRRARLPALPRGQRDVLRAGLDRAAPDARRAADRRPRRRRRCAGAQSDYPFNRGYMYASATMIYKFKSKAAGDVIMMGPTGDDVLRIGRPRAGAEGHHRAGGDAGARSRRSSRRSPPRTRRAPRPRRSRGRRREAGAARRSALRQRAWPLVEMMKRAQPPTKPIVWGV